VLCVVGMVAWLFAGLGGAWAETNSVPTGADQAVAPATNDLASFILKPGFRLEVVAEAPQVEAPVAMAFDENGRLFVAEMRDYPNRRQETPHLGQIRLLEDTNGTGRFESSTVFADNLPCPSSIACYDGGVFVAAAPDILFLKDTVGAGTANVRQAVFTGFGNSNAPNADVFLNNFNWGLDNRIHGASAGLGGIITVSNAAGTKPISMAGSDFCFDPRFLTLFPEAGPAQSGLCFDSRGRRFLSDFARPLRLPMYEPRYVARNAYVPRPPQFIDVLSPATAVFRYAAPKTAVPSSHDTNQPPPTTAQKPVALAPTWLTRAYGTVVYRGSAFPSNYLENVFIAEPAAHVIHHAVLHESGLEPPAGRAPGEANSEFLVSSDPSFHPMQIVNGPDGTLYIADFRNGAGSGRILRIVPEDFKQPEPVRLGQASSRDWVVALAHPDGWRRDTAARLLYQRPDPAAVPLLGNMLAHSKLPLARLHALQALEGLGALQEGHLLSALQDADYRVREHAVRLSENPLRNDVVSDALWTQLTARAADPSICVRYQLAFTLGETLNRARLPVLAKVLACGDDRWVRAAVLSSIAGSGGELLVMLAGTPQFGTSRAQAAWLEPLATMVGVEGHEAQVNGLLEFIDRAPLEPASAFALLSALGEGLHRTRSSLALVDPQSRLQRFYAEAQRLAVSRDAAEAPRVQAIRLLRSSPLGFSEVGDTLLLCIGSGESQAVQAAVLETLGHYDDPRIARALLGRWSVLPSTLRYQAAAALLSRTNRVPEVLNALEAGQLRREDLPPLALNFLRTYAQSSLRQRAVQLLGPVPGRHPETVQRFRPALGLKGLFSRGRELFRARCAACHAFGGQGSFLGPELASAKVAGKEKLLLAILEPNAIQKPGYTPSAVQTKPGELLLGVVRDENLKTLTLRQPNGKEAVWPRDNIEYVQPQPWSLMPDGLVQGLSTQDVADLLDYLMTGP
jgi:putative membrane-bound dehydrogenase-like protein